MVPKRKRDSHDAMTVMVMIAPQTDGVYDNEPVTLRCARAERERERRGICTPPKISPLLPLPTAELSPLVRKGKATMETPNL